MSSEERGGATSGLWLWENVTGPEVVLTVVLGVTQRPGLIQVEVRVAADAGSGEVGVRQEAALAVKRRAVAVETRCKEDHDVGLLPLELHLRVRHLLQHTARGGEIN